MLLMFFVFFKSERNANELSIQLETMADRLDEMSGNSSQTVSLHIFTATPPFETAWT